MQGMCFHFCIARFYISKDGEWNGSLPWFIDPSIDPRINRIDKSRMDSSSIPLILKFARLFGDENIFRPAGGRFLSVCAQYYPTPLIYNSSFDLRTSPRAHNKY